MCMKRRITKTLAPQRCIPRTSQPSVRSFVMCSIDVYAIGLPVVTSISEDGL